MGQTHSEEQAPRQLSIEQLSHELALRFATKCFTPLELAHFKDNFRTLADEQDGLRYWKEETLCLFLVIPDALPSPGPVIYQMCSYLGAFPFPSLAPSILTLESLVKVVVIMTERYGRVLKRGKKDRIKLLFRSLAIYDRGADPAPPEKPTMEELVQEQKPDDADGEQALKDVRSHVAGFSIDESANDEDEEEDDDELALAALDSLDAIEVFKQDQRADTKIHHALIPADNLKRLVMLLLVIAPLGPQENLSIYAEGLSKGRLQVFETIANNIIAAFNPLEGSHGIAYQSFTRTVSSSLPLIFDPLNALFEHFLFSKNLDLSRKKGAAAPSVESPLSEDIPKPTMIHNAPKDSILTPSVVAHLSFFLTTNPSIPNLFHSHTNFHPLYSTNSHGTSLTSLSRQVLSWQTSSLLLLSGSTSQLPDPITLGIYLPTPWKPDSSSSAHISTHETSNLPVLFQLSPRHGVFPGNPYHKSASSHISMKTGVAFGCVVPPSSRTSISMPALGPVALLIDPSLESATFAHSTDDGTGFFLPDPSLAATQSRGTSSNAQPKKIHFDIDNLEIWGLSTPPADGGEDEVQKQASRLAWEEAEAERRRGVNFGGDQEGARALLEMAGIVGDKSGSGRSGGSV